MSAKKGLREEIAKWKAIAVATDGERMRYAHIAVSLLNKFGGEISVTKENLANFTDMQAIQAEGTPDGGAMFRLVVKAPERHNG